ncbi:hypothetical protein ABLO18_16115 [Mycobacterium tuberculosis]
MSTPEFSTGCQAAGIAEPESVPTIGLEAWFSKPDTPREVGDARAATAAGVEEARQRQLGQFLKRQRRNVDDRMLMGRRC